MSDWCDVHPEYSADTEPDSRCERCLKLWFYKCPEEVNPVPEWSQPE